MKEMITNNWSLKVLAGVLAVMVWVIVNNVDDPVKKQVFHNIEVQIQHEDAIQDLDKVYEVRSGGVINVTASAKKSVLRKMKASDIVAVADLSNLSLTNAVSIQLYCPKYDRVELKSDITMLTIDLDNEKTEQYKVDVTTEGTLPEGYALGDIKVRPNLIKVSGAESQIERVSEVRVNIDVSDATENFTKHIEPQAYDANGKLLRQEDIIDYTRTNIKGEYASRLQFSSEKVKVSVEVNETKTVPIVINTTGNPAEGYHLISVDYEPQSVQITGQAQVLDKCSSIRIPCPINNAYEDVETEFTLSEYLPEGIRVVNVVESINVKVTISKQSLQEIRLPLSNIEIRNLKKDYTLDYQEREEYVIVKAIWAASERNEQLEASDLYAYIDCEELKEGSSRLEVRFDTQNEINIENVVYVKVKVSDTSHAMEEIIITASPTETPKITIEPTEALEEEGIDKVEKTEKPEEKPEEKTTVEDNVE